MGNDFSKKNKFSNNNDDVNANSNADKFCLVSLRISQELYQQVKIVSIKRNIRIRELISGVLQEFIAKEGE